MWRHHRPGSAHRPTLKRAPGAHVIIGLRARQPTHMGDTESTKLGAAHPPLPDLPDAIPLPFEVSTNLVGRPRSRRRSPGGSSRSDLGVRVPQRLLRLPQLLLQHLRPRLPHPGGATNGPQAADPAPAPGPPPPAAGGPPTPPPRFKRLVATRFWIIALAAMFAMPSASAIGSAFGSAFGASLLA